MSAKSKSNRAGKLKHGAQSRRELRRGYRFAVSITSAAPELGVSPSHLRKVLNGERQSPSLLARYNALKVA